MDDNFPQLILPQLATLVTDAPVGDNWLHEIKYDGYRQLCRRNGEQVDFFTRRGHRWSDKFPRIADSIRSMAAASRFWLDGELVVMLKGGKSCFGSLQQAVATRDQACLAYYAFDLLYLDGKDLCREPVETRKEMLFKLIGAGKWNLHTIDHIRGHGPEFFMAACQQNLEGIVSKKAGSIYRPEIRSMEWVKVKCRGYAEIRDVRWEWWKK